MSEQRFPDPNAITRQPGRPSVGATDEDIGDRQEAVTPEQAIEEFKAAKEAAEARERQANERAAAAQRERDEARRRATDVDSQAWTAHEQAIDQQITAQTALAEHAKAAFATAQAAGDAEGAAAAIERLTDAKAALRDLNNRKAYVGQQKQTPPQQRAQSQDQRQPDDSGVSVTTPGGQMRVSASAKDWMDKHARFYDDRDYYNHAVAAHGTIIADGIQEGSPAYFRALSDQMARFEKFEAYERGDHGENMTTTNTQNRQQPAQRRQPSAASMGAPVSRASAGSQNRDGTVDPLRIAQRFGGNTTIDDLREFARIAGFSKGPSDEAGFQKYLQEQEHIYQLERAGGDTGLRVDGVYR